MAWFDNKNPNNEDWRLKSLMSDDVLQLNRTTGQYERVGAGDGGDLPYYLKTNSIDIDEGANGTELTATNLTFGDAAGNISIDKTKAKILSDIKTDILDSPLIANGGSGDILFVGYDQISKKLVRSPATIKLGMNDVVFTNAGVKVKSGYYESYRFGCAAGLNKLQGFASTAAEDCAFSINLNGVFYKLNSDDIQVTNKLKAIAEKVTDANSKMLIYDATTKAFNYTALPSGGSATLPTYLGTNSIDLVTTSMEGSTIKISDPTSASFLRAGYITLQKISGTTTNANLTFNGVKAVENLEALSTTPRLGKKLVVYDPTTKVFNHADQNPNELTATMVNNSIVHQKWKPINVSGSEFYAPYDEDWGFRPVRRWLDIKKTGDTLFIDCSNYNVPMTSGSKIKMVFDVGLSGAAMLDATYENANITASCLYSQVGYKIGIPIQNETTILRWLYTLTLTATATTNLNAMIRIKVVDEIKGIRSNVEVVEPTLW
jgi:hypothetical protein